VAAGEEDSARGMAVAGGDGRAPLGSDTRRGKQVGPEEVLDPAAVDAMKRIPSPSGGGGAPCSADEGVCGLFASCWNRLR